MIIEINEAVWKSKKMNVQDIMVMFYNSVINEIKLIKKIINKVGMKIYKK